MEVYKLPFFYNLVNTLKLLTNLLENLCLLVDKPSDSIGSDPYTKDCGVDFHSGPTFVCMKMFVDRMSVFLCLSYVPICFANKIYI